MPGIIGFFDPDIDRAKGTTILKRMSDELFHHPFYRKDELFTLENIYAGRVHNNVIQNEPQPFVNEHVYVWIDGEIYDSEKYNFKEPVISHAHLLSSLYLKHNDFAFLKDMDSIFSAVIYDQKRRKLHFINDRYGLNFLYHIQKGDKLAWASEPKAMFSLKWFEPKIKDEAVQAFFCNTHLVEDQSWFEDLELFPPGSIQTWDLVQKKFIHKERYWSVDQVKSLPKNTKPNDILDELGSLFKIAVEKRTSAEEDIGITLSGGLDSRALLAAMPKHQKAIYAFTYGKPGCFDIEIARQVCKVDKISHHAVSLNSDNWLNKRVDSIWWTDGQMNLPHMHSLVFFPDITRYFNINLNGYLGDCVLGGSYIVKEGPMEKNINNRGRRLINEGTRLKENLGLHNRLPFFDYELMELTLAIPERLRIDSNVYNKMLVNEFPEYFKDIPWQKTGYSISTTKAGMLLKRKVMGRLKYTVTKAHRLIEGNAYESKRGFHNYSQWLREESEFVERVIKDPKAIYPEFISRNQVLKVWQSHLEGENHFHKVFAYLTFEIYLQQTFEGKYRPTPVTI